MKKHIAGWRPHVDIVDERTKEIENQRFHNADAPLIASASVPLKTGSR